MRCDDFICLGRTVPEKSTKYGSKVCMAGISESMGGLIRVYPLPVSNPIRVRHHCVLELERNPHDSRKESWKLVGHGDGIVSVSPRPVFKDDEIERMLRPYMAGSIRELNERRASLAVMELSGAYRGFFRPRKDDDRLDEKRFGAKAIGSMPYVEFWDAMSGKHRLQIREWGCYEWIRKHKDDAAALWGNLGFGGDRPIWAVIGNMNNIRSSWLIIKTFALPARVQLKLFNGAA